MVQEGLTTCNGNLAPRQSLEIIAITTSCRNQVVRVAQLVGHNRVKLYALAELSKTGRASGVYQISDASLRACQRNIRPVYPKTRVKLAEWVSPQSRGNVVRVGFPR